MYNQENRIKIRKKFGVMQFKASLNRGTL